MASCLTEYPSELLEIIVASYCNRQDTLSLWFAVSGCSHHAAFLWPILDRICNYRLRAVAQQKHWSKLKTCLSDFDKPCKALDERKQQTRSVSERLLLSDYSRELYGVVWCGRMEFSIPRHLRFHDKVEANVKLCCSDDLSWTFEAMRTWGENFPPSLSPVQIRSQMYNFVPIRPFGQLQGVSQKDKDVVARVRSELEETDQVMTLHFTQMKIILRIISPAQAHRRLAAFPGLLKQFSGFSEGLLCCWEVVARWEDEEPLNRLQKATLLASIVKKYWALDAKYDFRWHLFHFFEDLQ